MSIGQRSIGSLAIAAQPTCALTVVEPPVVEDTGFKGVGGRKVHRAKVKHSTYADRKRLDEEVYNLIVGEVKTIVPPKMVQEVVTEVVSNIRPVDDTGSIINESLLKEMARLQAWLIVEKLKRDEEEDDERALLLLL